LRHGFPVPGRRSRGSEEGRESEAVWSPHRWRWWCLSPLSLPSCSSLGVFVRLTPLKKGAVGLVEAALWERRGEIGGGVGTDDRAGRESELLGVTKNSGRGGSSTAALHK